MHVPHGSLCASQSHVVKWHSETNLPDPVDIAMTLLFRVKVLDENAESLQVGDDTIVVSLWWCLCALHLPILFGLSSNVMLKKLEKNTQLSHELNNVIGCVLSCHLCNQIFQQQAQLPWHNLGHRRTTEKKVALIWPKKMWLPVSCNL